MFLEYPTEKSCFLIVSENKHAITCTVEGEPHAYEHYLWNEEDGDIVSVRCGRLIGFRDPEMEVSLILCKNEEPKHTFKMILS